MRPTDLPLIVQSVIESLRPAAEAKRIHVAAVIAPGFVPVAGDPDRLKQVVWNLVSNAIKFTPADGWIEVRLESTATEIHLTVCDSGIGFEPAVAAHLFQRFRQGDSSSTREHGGLGLGLGIVRHVVELHGGTVTAASGGEGAGSVFRVQLPWRPWEAPIEEPPQLEPATPSLRGISVMVVDGDGQQLNFVRSSLEQYGAVVVTASSAQEAKDRFRREPTDVLISDLLMPDGDGYELIRDIRQLDRAAGRTTPAAALTALARTDDRRSALTAGYQLHLAKPMEPMELVSTIERLASEGGTRLAGN
jgi:CheY-like chemotaxis protein